MTPPYPRIHVIINPSAGKDEPILNILNDVFSKYDVDWSVSVTKKFGDAELQAKKAIAEGVDLVAGYGGDGTQHELANAMVGSGVPMGILPGGTGNGFLHEFNIPTKLSESVEILCQSTDLRETDVGKIGDQFFILRLYAGIEPEKQTTREMKNKYGPLAYGISLKEQITKATEVEFKLNIDDESFELSGVKCYIVNSAQTGSGIPITIESSIDDGLLDVFMLTKDIKSMEAAAHRFLHLKTHAAGLYYWQGKHITIESEPSKAIWTDGELFGRTPISVEVVPQVLSIVVPSD